MSLTVKSTDGKAHNIQFYSDISADGVSGDNSLDVTWSTNNLNGVLAHQVQLQNQGQYTEINDHTQYGSAYYGTNTASGLSYATGQNSVIRAQFISSGSLGNSQDIAFRAISDRWPVFAFARDIGSTSDSSANPVGFAVGHVRDPLITYIVAGNTMQDRHPYWLSKFATVSDCVEYQHAVNASNAMDNKVTSDSNAIYTDYAPITALSLRQAMGGIEITISKTSSGVYDPNDIFIYPKEISSDVYLYPNPDLGKRLLAPIFTHQRSGLYPNKWSVHDFGSSYLVANGHNNGGDEAMAVEESGNMIIMALSYYRAKKDSTFRLSTDDFAGHLANQTNLAIKGIIGIRAMFEIATVLGQSADASTYSSKASSYVTQWEKYAISSEGHLMLQYNSPSSWGMAYNL
ncbi:glutaminase GtaA [Ceratobasidium sp. AG-Ba]|nr:glutaminase GtaA [Ceratobasidium sp. AG-Ba]